MVAVFALLVARDKLLFLILICIVAAATAEVVGVRRTARAQRVRKATEICLVVQ